MCGILGIVDSKGINENQFEAMRDTMFHRGPDDAGTWFSRNREVGLAHRRLSIIDLSEAGRQPMSDKDRSIWITYNGEIYNFLEIRKELTDRGYIFESRTDTEVIINAYKEWGTECLEKFNGMFAFAIYDERKRTIFLGRDRMGKKPLYYFHDKQNRRLLFASELKALLKDNGLSKEIDLHALNSYFTFGYISGEYCIFKDVKKLLPAHAMTYSLESNEKTIWNYWDLPLYEKRDRTEGDLLEELESLLEDAVRMRMISDVPLGAFLSGGVDSSLIVAMMSRISDIPVKTFSIGFEDSAFNELPYARIVADHFGTEHHELIVRPDAFSILPDLVHQFDEPFADQSMIPTYYVSKATREYVTVALSGDGGDEIFGGYKIYRAALFDYYARIFTPSFLRKLFVRSAEYISGDRMRSIKKQLLLLGLDMNDVFVERYAYAFFREAYRRQLFSDNILGGLNSEFSAPESVRRAYMEERKGDIIDRMTYTDMKSYLPDDILVKVDRASMLVSLESRAPLLDYRIADFAFRNIPGGLKVKAGTGKYLLKKLAAKLLPTDLDIKRKWGFVMPISGWFRGEFLPQVKEILLDGSSGYFDLNYVEKLLDEHNTGKDNSFRLYALMVFNLWKREYLGSG